MWNLWSKDQKTRVHRGMASLMFTCDLWMVYSEPLLDWLVVSPSSATLVNSCGIPFIGFQSASVSFIGFLQLLGVVSLALLLFIFRSFLSYLRPVRMSDRFARPLVVTIWYHVLTRPLNRIGHSRRLVPLSGMTSFQIALSSTWLFELVLSLLKTFFLPGPGLGALLSSYLEGALYKFYR